MDKIKPTFRLTKIQNEQLMAKEHASFIRHCERLGRNPKEAEKKAIEKFRKRDIDMIKGIRIRAARECTKPF